MKWNDMHPIIAWKLIFLIQFSCGVIISMITDLLVLHNGQLQTALLWQIVVASLLSSILQVLFYPRSSRISALRVGLHCLCTYVLMLTLALIFHWLNWALTEWLVFSGIFFAIYAGVFAGFAALYHIEKLRLSDLLAAYKRNHTSK